MSQQARHNDGAGDFSSFPLPDFLSEVSTLKPKLDSIFAEVQQNLPDIDFEVSDVSSEEDVPIFHRALRTPTSEDGDERELDGMWNECKDDSYNSQVLEPLQVDTSNSNSNSNLAQSLGNFSALLGIPASQEIKQRQQDNQQRQGNVSEDSNLAESLGNFAAMLGIPASQEQQNSTSTSSLQSTMLSSTLQLSTTTPPSSTRSSTRPSTAPVLRDFNRRPVPRKNNWMDEKESSEAVISTEKENVSKEKASSSRGKDAHEQKRREVPELSPKEGEQKRRRSFTQRPDDIVQQYLPTRSAMLPLESMDIDGLLSAALVGGATGGGAGDTFRHARREYDPLAEVSSQDSTPLIQRLAQMSMLQSGTELDNIDPTTGALIRRTQQDTNKQNNTPPPVSPLTKAVSMGTNTSDRPNLPMEMPKKPERPEKETVYLDLRGFDKNTNEQKQNYESIQRILKITNTDKRESSSSSEDESEEEEMWHEQRKRIKDSLSKTGQLPESFTKPKARKNTAPDTNLPLVQTHARRLAGHLPPDKGSKSKVPKQELPNEPMPDAPVAKAPAVNIEEAERLRKLEIAKKVREERERERQSRIRLGTRLEALRPTRSVGGKHPAAESTPTLFDVEASYEPAPKSLPENESRETVLLTIRLSSPGEMVQHRSSHKSVDAGCSGVSGSYTSLIAWFLSLVAGAEGETTSPPVPFSERPVPFRVIGLQQMYFDDQLCLYVAVVPAGPIQATKLKKGKGSLFQQAVSKYLSVSTLASACPWLLAFQSIDIVSSSGSVYTPPLPTITSKLLSTFIQMSDDLEAAKKMFSLPVGFFWVTMETEEEPSCDYDLNDGTINYDTQNTMSLIYEKVYRDPSAMMGILHRILQMGLDLAGLRLLYPSAELINMTTVKTSPSVAPPGGGSSTGTGTGTPPPRIGAVLALAVRGQAARSMWLEALGPADPVLARRTDPTSLCALYGGVGGSGGGSGGGSSASPGARTSPGAECSPLFAPRNPSRVLAELARWFGGRVPASGVVNVGAGHGDRPGAGKRKAKQRHDPTDIQEAGPVSCVAAAVLSDVVVVVSPLFPPRALGLLLYVCQQRGFQLRGIRRSRLNTRTATNIGLSAVQVPIFSVSGSMPTSPTVHSATFRFDTPPAPPVSIKPSAGRPSATILLLSKENAGHTTASLIEAFMVHLCLQGVLRDIESELASGPATASMLFHWMPYSDATLNLLGGDLTKTPETDVISTPGFIAPKLHSNPELEQIVVLTFTGKDFMKNAASFLCQVLGVSYNPRSHAVTPPPSTACLELVGIKWVARVPLQHAKELTPHEVGTRQWKPSIHTLTSQPALVTVLRGINAFRCVSTLLNQRNTNPSGGNGAAVGNTLERILSPSPELAYRQVTLFFRDRELFPDNSARPLLPYLPPPAARLDDKRGKSSSSGSGSRVEESVIKSMVTGAVPLVTVLLLKPDTLKRHLPKLLRKLTQSGFSIVAFHHTMLKPDQAHTLIPPADRQNSDLRDLHLRYLTSGPCLALGLQRENAIKHLLDQLGPTDPKQAKHQSAFLWRAMFGLDAVRNGLHASSNYQAAMEEIQALFPAGLCCRPTPELLYEHITCPSDDLVMGVEAARGRGISGLGQAGGLMQTNVALLTPALLTLDLRNKRAPYVDVLTRLLAEGFEIVGGRMIWFSRTQVEEYLHLSEAGSFALADYLMGGPCLVLALQRDNAVLAFDAHLGSSFDKDSVYCRYGPQILRAKTMEQAEKQLCFFFDELAPSAQITITATQEGSATKP